MADFALIHESNALPVWINLDYVIRIERGLDPTEPTLVRLVGNSKLTLSRAEGDRLVAQLNQCCKGPRQSRSGAPATARRARERSKSGLRRAAAS